MLHKYIETHDLESFTTDELCYTINRLKGGKEMHAPHFNLKYIDKEKQYNLKESRGSIILLTFWVSWCPDCSTDLPKKEHLFQSIDHDHIKMLTINVTGRERDPNDGIRFAEKFLSQPTLVDDDRKVYDAYHCKSVPTTIIIDQNGHICYRFDDNANVVEIISALGQLLEKNKSERAPVKNVAAGANRSR